jgi:hypothetical protein
MQDQMTDLVRRFAAEREVTSNDSLEQLGLKLRVALAPPLMMGRVPSVPACPSTSAPELVTSLVVRFTVVLISRGMSSVNSQEATGIVQLVALKEM